MTRPVEIIVTSQIIGKKWSLSPYNPTQGVEGAPEYKVPTYRMKLVGNETDFW